MRARSVLPALLLAFGIAGAARGDFAPLAVGHTWVYRADEQSGGIWWNPRYGQKLQRTLKVESSQPAPGGVDWVIAWRDSLSGRYFESPYGSSKPLDTVLSGRFRVREASAGGFLRTLPDGAGLPAGMEHFFRTRTRPDSAVRTLPGEGGEVHEARMQWSRNSWDRFGWLAGYGLAFWKHNYDVFDTEWYTPPYRYATLRLHTFNGKAAPPFEPGIAAAPARLAYGFAPLEGGMSWAYRGLRQLVERDGPNSPHRVIRDSVTRTLRVDPIAGTDRRFRVECVDVLHARAYNGTPRGDSVGTAVFTVEKGHPDSLLPLPRLGGTFADLRQFWNFDGYPEETLAEMDGPQGPIQVALVAAREPALFTDTMAYGQGIGFLFRSKTLRGVMGLVERRDWRLVEYRGRPFELPTSLPVHPAENPRMRRKFPDNLTSLRGRDLLGRHQGVPEPTPEAAIPLR